jgi:predicted NUDIX family phosphoesterase
MAKNDENVLVVPRAHFDQLGAFQGLNKDPKPYLEKFLDRENNLFLARSKAEDDPSYKQLIPYAVFVHDGKILYYVRGGSSGEKRLVAKGSIGIGGHVNDTDEGFFSIDAGTYHNAVRREISEELKIGGAWSERIVALINDDSTEVGSVHLGVVHLVTLETNEVSAGEKAIAELQFLTPDELKERSASLETWSQIIVAAWDEL